MDDYTFCDACKPHKQCLDGGRCSFRAQQEEARADTIERLSAERDKLKHDLKMAFSEDDKLIVMKEMQTEINTYKARIAALEADCLTMTLRLMDESPDTFAPETAEVFARWEPKALDMLDAQERALQELATQAQELGMGYDERKV